jgi:hypothetical protein
MKNSRRISLIILLLALAFLLAFLFRAFLLENFVRPVALVFWLIYQVFLSFDQRLIWGLLIFAAVVSAYIRLSLRGLAESQPVPDSDSQFTLDTIDYWRTFLLSGANEAYSTELLKQKLVRMLATIYTSRTPETPQWEIYEALEKRQIPLPEHIYTFLFPLNPSAGRPSFQQILRILRSLPGKFLHRWSGRARTEYYQMIEEVLKFMESSLEIKHDN